MEHIIEKPKRHAVFSTEHTLTRKAIADILANGLWQGGCGFDDICFDKDDYAEAKSALIAEGMKPEGICVEDVEAEMLLMGKAVKLHMLEEKPNEEWYDLTLAKLIEGLRKYGENPINGSLADVLNGDPDCRLDSNDYDAILQYACYGDIIIG